MAKKVYIAEFDANADPYLRKLKGIENKTATMSKNVESSLGKINDSYLKMAAGIAAVGTVTNFIADSIRAYGEEEKIVKRLDVALGKRNRTLQAYASQLQRLTTFEDGAIMDAMALIANYVKEEGMVKKLTKATMDLAVAKGIDLSSAAEIVAKTVGSSTNALKRQGIEFDNNLKGVERVNAVLDQLARFQGQAEGQADTYTGKLEQLNNQLADLQEQIGAGVLPTLNEFSTTLTDIAGKLGSSGISELLDKYIKLLTIVPRTGLKGINAIGNLFGFGGGPTLDPKDFITNSGSYSNFIGGIGMTSDTTGSGNGKGPRITGGNTTRDAVASNIGASGILNDVSARGISSFSRDMQEVAVPELQASFDDISLSFVQKFGETQNIAGNIANIFNVTADSFVGKLMQAFDVANSVLSIIASVASLAGSPLGFLGLAKGGTVINKSGKLSYAPIPKFARGGSYMVPAGYSNDSGLIRVQSGERVDVTPSHQVPMLGKALGEIKQAIMAGNMNNARKGKQPVVVNVMLDGVNVTKSNLKNQNRMSGSGQDFGDYN